MPKPPKFVSKDVERDFLKFRLAQTFRIFGNFPYMSCEFNAVNTHVVSATQASSDTMKAQQAISPSG